MKICIIGPSGAGKTTLAKQLAKELSLPAYAFDEIYWDISGRVFIKNSECFISAKVDSIKMTENWIVEGAYDRRLLPFFKDCCLILRLNIPYWCRVKNLIKRFLVNRIQRQMPKETLVNTWALLRFSKQYDNRLDKFFNNHPELNSKIIVISDASAGIKVCHRG